MLQTIQYKFFIKRYSYIIDSKVVILTLKSDSKLSLETKPLGDTRSRKRYGLNPLNRVDCEFVKDFLYKDRG